MLFKKTQKYFFILVPIIGLLFFFQNCGSQYDAQHGSVEQDYSEPDVEGDALMLQAASVAPSYVLPTSVVPLIEKAKMNWSFDTNSSDFNNAINGLSGQCATKRADFEATRKLAPIVYDEGLLPGDPKIAQMKEVKASFDKALDVAFCVYFSSSVTERQSAFASIAKYISDWNATYVGDGNPINERFFTKLFFVADLVFPKLNATQIRAIRSLATRMDQKEVKFMGTLNANDGRLKNNWYTRHLMIRVYANIILNNATKIQELKIKINQDIISQYSAPTGFKLSTCGNLKNIGVYGSYDLQQRDAFVYHLSGIAELAPFMVSNPTIVGVTQKAKLLAAVNIMKPYVLGTKVHPEFRCTSVQYDKDKLALDPTLGANWNPDNAKVFFRYARLLWVETDPWTTRYVTTAYAPWFKIFFTGKGDIL